MDGDVKKLDTREYLKLCQKQWRWILDNYDRLIKWASEDIRALKGAYFDEYGLDKPESRCYLCELTDTNCPECPLSGIAWRKDYSCPCVTDEGSIYGEIRFLMRNGRHEEAKAAIEQFLLMITETVEAAGP